MLPLRKPGKRVIGRGGSERATNWHCSSSSMTSGEEGGERRECLSAEGMVDSLEERRMSSAELGRRGGGEGAGERAEEGRRRRLRRVAAPEDGEWVGRALRTILLQADEDGGGVGRGGEAAAEGDDVSEWLLRDPRGRVAMWGGTGCGFGAKSEGALVLHWTGATWSCALLYCVAHS